MSQPPNHLQEEDLPVHNVVDASVDGESMRGIVAPGGENVIGVQRQIRPAGITPPRMQQTTPSQTKHRPQEQIPSVEKGEQTPHTDDSDGSRATCNYVSTETTGTSVQGIVAPGGTNHIGEQHQSIGYHVFQERQRSRNSVPRSQGQYPPLNYSGNANIVRTVVSGFNQEGITAPGGYNQIDRQEQTFVPMQSQERTPVPMQNQQRTPVPMLTRGQINQRQTAFPMLGQEQHRLERALAILSANPQVLDAVEKFSNIHQPPASEIGNPHPTSVAFDNTTGDHGDYPSADEGEEEESVPKPTNRAA